MRKSKEILVTEVPPIDYLIEGGLQPGETYVHLSPTGGGKTTLATQLAAEAGKQESKCGSKEKILYWELEGNVTHLDLLLSAGASIKRQECFDRFTSGIPLREEAQARFRDFERIAKQHIVIYKGCSYSPDLLTEIEHLSNKHNSVRLIIVDSLCALIDINHLSSRMPGSPGKKDYILALNRLKIIAKRLNAPIWLTHQLGSPSNLQRSVGVAPDYHNAHMLKEIWQHVHSGFASGKLDKNNQAIFKGFSRESGEGKNWIGKLRTDIAGWAKAEADWIISGEEFQRIQSGRIPQTYDTNNWDPSSEGFAV